MATRFQGVLLAAVMLMLTVSLARGDMLISPTRAALDGDNRSATLTLRNTGDGPRSYRLEWEDRRMSAEGTYSKIEEDEEWRSASGMIRHSPRQITVGPGENQTVRLSYRPPADLAPGEYRSHLRLQVIPDVSEPAGVTEVDVDAEGIGVRLFMQMSYTLPVVVRHEVEPPDVRISSVEVLPPEEGKSRRLAVTLEREGEASSYGNVVVEMQRDANSPVETIGNRGEVAVFHEMNQRVVRVPLRDAAIPAGAWIRVAYEGQHEYSGTLWDERVFQSE